MVQLIIRDDDLNFFNRPEDIEKAYRRMPDLAISFACVPFIMDLSTKGNCPETKGNTIPRPFGNNQDLVEYLKKGIKEGKYDILLHGNTHEYRFDSAGNRHSEMIWRKYSDTVKRIPEGKSYLENLFDTSITWFAAPSNIISKENLRAVYENNLNYSGIIRMRFDRDISFRSIHNYAKRMYYWYAKKIHYPGLFNYGTHLEINATPLPSLDQDVIYGYFTHLFDFCKKHDLPLAINVHCWDMRDHPEKYDAFFSFVKYAIAHGAVPSRFRDLKV